MNLDTPKMILELFQQFQKLAQTVTIPAGVTLFQETVDPTKVYSLIRGRCIISEQAIPLGEAKQNQILDWLPCIGGIAHRQRAITLTECEFLCWDVADLWQNVDFSMMVRAYLADALLHTQPRLEALSAPIHFLPDTTLLPIAPFVFDNTAILFLFCHAPKLKFAVPEGVSRVGDRVLVAIAQFRDAHPESMPDASFSYTETTVFAPIRVGVQLGLTVPYIYPSTYEPILLGREIYGFPKQLGETMLQRSRASLRVNGQTMVDVDWQDGTLSTEASLVGAFGTVFRAQEILTSTAFRVGDNLLKAMQIPFYRRVGVFNHKRIAGTESRQSQPKYDVDQLTQCIFSVLRWYQIEKLQGVALAESSYWQSTWGLRIEQAYCTTLDLRLSTGRIIRDYRANPNVR